MRITRQLRKLMLIAGWLSLVGFALFLLGLADRIPVLTVVGVVFVIVAQLPSIQVLRISRRNREFGDRESRDA